jgi:hypothetical protein
MATVQTWEDQLSQGTTQIEGRCPRPTAGWPHLALTDAWQNQFTVTVKCSPPRVLVVGLQQWATHGHVARPISLWPPLRPLLHHLVK